jgi:hypothetical protein
LHPLRTASASGSAACLGRAFRVGRARRRAVLVAVTALLAATAVLVAAAPQAQADAASKIVLRCTHGESLSGFSQQAYRKALRTLPTEVAEYTECAELIRRAQLAAAGGGRGGGGGGVTGSGGTSVVGPSGAIAVTPVEQRAIESAHHSGSAPVHIGNQLVRPGVVHADIASAVSALPTPLLAVLAFLLASVLAVGTGALRHRVHLPRSH